jgi:uncharacterized protein YjbI with pentapeptide repeats
VASAKGSSGSVDDLRLIDVTLQEADFSGRNLRLFSVGGRRLVRCDFGRIRAPIGSLGEGYESTHYVECVFDGARFKVIAPGRATFLRCSFRDVQVGEIFAKEAEFVDCVFSGRIRTAVFSGTPYNTAHLDRDTNLYLNNDFSQVTFGDVAFRRGVDLAKQRLPSGPEYVYIHNGASALARAEVDVRTWPDQHAIEKAKVVLGVLGSGVAGGQRDLFTTRALIVKRLGPDYTERLLQVLNGSSGME